MPEQEHRPSPLVWTIPLAFAVLYALWPMLKLPRFYYAPLTRQFFWHGPKGMPAMGWYGRLVLAIPAGIIAGGLLALLVKRLPASWQRLGPYFAALAVAASMAIIAVYEARRWML